jgi:hypothetical protein
MSLSPASNVDIFGRFDHPRSTTEVEGILSNLVTTVT